MASGQSLFDEQVNDGAVFSMQREHAAIGTDLAQHAKNGGVVGHHHAGVGHEHFETAHAFVVHGVAHVLQHLFVHAGDDHVQTVVDVHLGFSAALRAGNRPQRRVFSCLQSEVHHGGGAPKGRGLGTAGKGVAGHGGAHHVFHVHMGVNAARQHIQARGVHHLHIVTHFHVVADGVHDAVFEQDIGHIVIGGRDDATVSDQGGFGVVRHEKAP